jgi:hypothetical protein
VDFKHTDAINEALQQEGMQLLETVPKKRRRTTTAPDDVITSAERATVLPRFENLTDFYGGGRKLRQTGQPTIADAKELVSRLGAKDLVDMMIGDRTFKTKSAAELRQLAFTIRWAPKAGAPRKEHGKLCGSLPARPG